MVSTDTGNGLVWIRCSILLPAVVLLFMLSRASVASMDTALLMQISRNLLPNPRIGGIWCHLHREADFTGGFSWFRKPAAVSPAALAGWVRVASGGFSWPRVGSPWV